MSDHEDVVDDEAPEIAALICPGCGADLAAGKLLAYEPAVITTVVDLRLSFDEMWQETGRTWTDPATYGCDACAREIDRESELHERIALAIAEKD